MLEGKKATNQPQISILVEVDFFTKTRRRCAEKKNERKTRTSQIRCHLLLRARAHTHLRVKGVTADGKEREKKREMTAAARHFST